MSWHTPPTGKAADFVMRLGAMLPRIETERLVLRAPKITDWPTLEPIWTTDRGAFIGGPMNSEDAWLDFNQCLSSWLIRGTGALTITAKGNDTPLGLVMIAAEHGDPKQELGWLLTEAAEGKGYATEAARALRDWGFDVLGQGTFVSYVHKDNAPSIRVAKRLGATPRSEKHPLFSECIVFGHDGTAQ